MIEFYITCDIFKGVDGGGGGGGGGGAAFLRCTLFAMQCTCFVKMSNKTA